MKPANEIHSVMVLVFSPRVLETHNIMTAIRRLHLHPMLNLIFDAQFFDRVWRMQRYCELFCL